MNTRRALGGHFRDSGERDATGERSEAGGSWRVVEIFRAKSKPPIRVSDRGSLCRCGACCGSRSSLKRDRAGQINHQVVESANDESSLV